MGTTFPTLAEQKATATRRFGDSCESLKRLLAHYARKHGGRFLIYGSVARGEYRFDSDVDLLVDFPEGQETDAWRFAEDACWELGLKADIGVLRTRSQAFIDHIQGDMKVIL